MGSIVLGLQNEVTKPDCDIVNVLRKAHLISVKLNLSEFDKWISCELNGYIDGDNIPDYRKVRGVLKVYNPYNGWIPVVIPDSKIEKRICYTHVPNSVSEIISFREKNDRELISEYTGEQLALINQLVNTPVPMRCALFYSNPAIGDIVEKVKNAVLEWTIQLEAEGILGDGMQFNPAEKEIAKRIPQTINNYYGNTNVINAPVEHSAVIAGNDNSAQFTYEKASEAITEIEAALDGEEFAAEDKETVIEMLTEIRDKISEQKKPSFIKAALTGLKDFLIGVGASATVAVVEAKINGLF